MSAGEPDGDWSEYDDGGTVRRLLRRWGRVGGIVAALGMAAIFAAAAWYALQRSDMQPRVLAEVPLVRAELGPVKEKPEDPGGLKIPNQDKLVFERITPKPQGPKVEKLAPAPEEPIVKPPAPAAPALVGAPVDTAATPPTDTAREETGEDRAAAKAMAKETAVSPATVAAREHAAPPAIAGNKDNAMGSKVESLLPAPETTAIAADSKADLPTPTTQTAAMVKSTPKTMEKSVAAAPKTAAKTESPKIAAPKIVAPKVKAPAKKAPVAKAPAAKKVKSGYRIQLVSHRKAKLADAAWRSLRKTHADILGDLTGHTARVVLGKRGVYYRVQAGFFGNEAKARSACAKLKAKRQDCIIVPPR
jgi:hypothetical protein